MQPVDQFMAEFFQARTAEIERELENRESFRLRYFAKNCRWDNRAGALERSQSESVVSIWNSDSEARVVTRQDGRSGALRYHLQPVGESWIIRCIDMQCLFCQGTGGNNDCICCNGTGWVDGEQIARLKISPPAAVQNQGRPGIRRRR